MLWALCLIYCSQAFRRFSQACHIFILTGAEPRALGREPGRKMHQPENGGTKCVQLFGLLQTARDTVGLLKIQDMSSVYCRPLFCYSLLAQCYRSCCWHFQILGSLGVIQLPTPSPRSWSVRAECGLEAVHRGLPQPFELALICQFRKNLVYSVAAVWLT